MSGFFGIAGGLPESLAILEDIDAALKHRGPDSTGMYMDRTLGILLRHFRLAIIDLSKAANQPIFNESKTVCAAIDGEIYNFVSLRSELKSAGHLFSSMSDSEVVVHGYEEWGEEVLHKLRGMFAIAIWDSRTSMLLLARDRIGIKPLYYTLGGKKQIFFASEAKALVACARHGFFETGVREDSVEALLLCGYIPDSERTALQNIYKLPPAHKLVFQQGECRISRYWQLESDNQKALLSFPDACEELYQRLSESVRLMLQSDAPVGILLSGGLDSSVVASIAAREHKVPVRTYTLGFQQTWDERRFARCVAEHIGSEHHEFFVDPSLTASQFADLATVFDDLTSVDGGFISTMLMCQKVKMESDVKVLLAGEGADEIFGGYPFYCHTKLPYRLLPKYVRAMLQGYSFSGILHPRSLARISSLIRQSIQPEDDEFQSITRFEIERQLPNHYLMKDDKSTMAHSVELRVPFLDEHLVQFAFSLSPDVKMKGSWYSFQKPNEKFVLRRVAESLLPEQITQRKKNGFPFALLDFLAHNKGAVRETLLQNKSIALRFFERDELTKLTDSLIKKDDPLVLKRKFVIRPRLEKARVVLAWRLFAAETWRKAILG